MGLVFPFFVLLKPLCAQVNETNPIRYSRNLIQEEEIIFSYTQISSTNSSLADFVSEYYKPNVTSGENDPLSLIKSEKDIADNLPAGPAATSIVTGNFFGDEYGEGIVHAFIGNDEGSPHVILVADLIKRFASNSISLGENVHIVGPVLNTGSQLARVALAAGNFDDDDEYELAVVFHAEDERLHMELFDLSITLEGDMGSISFSQLRATTFTSEINDRKYIKGFDATEVDLDFDGIDELAVGYIDDEGILNLALFETDSEIFQSPSNEILFTPELDPCFGTSELFGYENLSLGIASGELSTGFFGEELVLAAHFGIPGSSGSPGANRGLYVFPIRTSLVPGTGERLLVKDWCEGLDEPFYFTNDDQLLTEGELAFDVATGDIDGTLDDESVVVFGNRVIVLDFLKGQRTSQEDYLLPSELASFNISVSPLVGSARGEGTYADNFLDVGNIDPLVGNFGSDFRAEILIGKNFLELTDFINGRFEQHFELTVYGFEESGSQGAINFQQPIIRAKKEMIAPSEAGEYRARRFTAVLGDVDGGSVILGDPRRTEVADILNPSLIMNAPPTHFDVFGATSYDVSNLYDAGEAVPSAFVDHFFSQYTSLTTSSFTFNTSFTTDYSLSADVEASFAASGFSIGGKFSQTYGKRFTNFEENEKVFSITNVDQAQRDDQLLAYKVSYSVFEYPVYRLGETTDLTHVVVVIPKEVRETFISARSPSGNYRPDHQHGNLFSYPSSLMDLDINFTSPQVFEGLKSREISKLSGGGSGFTVTQSQSTMQGVEEEISTSTTVGANIGGAFKGVGLDVSVEGTYSTAELTNRTSSYRQDVELTGAYGQGEDITIPGDYSYFLTPIVYWDAGGALTLDYLVDISKLGFFQSFYNSYDPAFLLLEPFKTQKGLDSVSTYNDTDRYQTREIFFSTRPTPGDSIDIFARIHNYGYLSTPIDTFVEVAFFYLDPEGSAQLESIGKTTIRQSFLGRDDALDREVISIPWRVPANLGSNTKLVAIIDPDDRLKEEIHDYPEGNGVSNNIGWTCLFLPNCEIIEDQSVFFSGNVTSIDQQTSLGEISKAYPNPFANKLAVEITTPSTQFFDLEVRDLHGRLVYEEKDMLIAAGTHSMTVNTADWPEGLYIYRLQGKFYQETAKIVLSRY